MEKVRDEIIQMLKGLLCSAVFPAMALHFAGTPLSQAFCGWGDYSLSYHVFTGFVVWLGSDFYEFSYHRLGHIDFRFWKQVAPLFLIIKDQFFNPYIFSTSITMSFSILLHLVSNLMILK